MARRDVTESLRELGIQLAQLNRRVSGRLGLRDVDMDCLDLINRLGPIGPGVLARTAGLHPATVTGILDRLERDGWIVRERAPEDRRAVLVRALPQRGGEVFQQFAGMNGAVREICSDYDAEQLRVIAEFLERVAEAGRAATAVLEQQQN
ncbi:MarR family winged helix-turn-helix transcriptional regulator [Streptacidiphilus fuscans]|uniref:MarR family winged helix-turn-helix transcriptional regulator n=1 Tax=Streptacidiphilus fuscans TaxID=2789292 RepID=UPI002E2D9669|nr:MarR family transcriptional regulator [Streptacidiphilus fuscans]